MLWFSLVDDGSLCPLLRNLPCSIQFTALITLFQIAWLFMKVCLKLTISSRDSIIVVSLNHLFTTQINRLPAHDIESTYLAESVQVIEFNTSCSLDLILCEPFTGHRIHIAGDLHMGITIHARGLGQLPEPACAILSTVFTVYALYISHFTWI